MTPPTAPVEPAAVRRAAAAIYVAFFSSGFAFASWAARIPQVRDRLHLDPRELGLVLLATAVGSVVALPLSGPVIARFGSARTVMTTAVLFSVGLAAAALGSLVAVAPVVVGLFLIGLAYGAWDVAMNVQGTVVERHWGRSTMARFHAGYSLGTVAGALLGTALVAVGVPVAIHLAVVALAVAVAVPAYARAFLPDTDTPPSRRGTLSAWREPRTLLIGVFVLAFSFAEGVGNDWMSVAAIDGHHVSPALGTLAYATFLTAMTVGRWLGPWLLDRFGRAPVVRSLAVVGITGVVVFVFGPAPAYAYPGALLWGLGVALGFPVGMSAGGDDPRRAAARVSVIASVGYCAFLVGPPTIGLIGDRSSVLRALLVAAALFALASLLADSVRLRSGVETETMAPADDLAPEPTD